jgi:hypothetical protein
VGGACSTNGEERNAYRFLVRKPEGKRPLERPRPRWVYNSKTNLGENIIIIRRPEGSRQLRRNKHTSEKNKS